MLRYENIDKFKEQSTYCRQSLNRIDDYIQKNASANTYDFHSSVAKADIVKLRRELQELSKMLDSDYGREVDE